MKDDNIRAIVELLRRKDEYVEHHQDVYNDIEALLCKLEGLEGFDKYQILSRHATYDDIKRLLHDLIESRDLIESLREGDG